MMHGRNLIKRNDFTWEIPISGRMRVPAVLYASKALLAGLEESVFTQIANVASLPGIVGKALTMPDAHSGYGFPIGGVAAFDPENGGVVSAGGVGFDISCGVRALTANISFEDVDAVRMELADKLFSRIPAGIGVTGDVRLTGKDMDAMLEGGAAWAVGRGFGEKADLERIEESGRMPGAQPDKVSDLAKKRQRDETGTLGSGNHYLEVQQVEEIFDEAAADAFGLSKDGVLVSVHCGSRGLGHQIGTDYLSRMLREAPKHGITLPDKELACAPIDSETGRDYLGAMRAGINCALANRQILTHLVREVFAEAFPGARLRLLYDVSHNTCKAEDHIVDGKPRRLFVHRKGATRAFGPGHPALPQWLGKVGQPVLVGGSMGTSSYILCGARESMDLSLGSTCHGAGRAMSRKQAFKRFSGREIFDQLARVGVTVRAHGFKGLGEEAPGAYKDIDEVVETSHTLGLARKVARLRPIVCIKG
jgi:tRNA-splicing ligase RtcB (3'-phosphate/5'-hydroxy nucleic acid ligase)